MTSGKSHALTSSSHATCLYEPNRAITRHFKCPAANSTELGRSLSVWQFDCCPRAIALAFRLHFSHKSEMLTFRWTSWISVHTFLNEALQPRCTLVPEAFFYSLLANFATRTASFIFYFCCWHEALRAAKRKPLVETVGNLTFMPSAFDRRFWLEDIFNCSTSHMIGWIKYLWGW